MPVVEPNVSREKLGQLLDEQHESESLDYEATCDLRERRDVVELAKDVGAMQVDGGFIVVGADDRGNPTGQLTLPGERWTRRHQEATGTVEGTKIRVGAWFAPFTSERKDGRRRPVG